MVLGAVDKGEDYQERFKLLSEEARQGIHFREEIQNLDKRTSWIKI